MRNEVGDKVVGEENLAVFCRLLQETAQILPESYPRLRPLVGYECPLECWKP